MTHFSMKNLLFIFFIMLTGSLGAIKKLRTTACQQLHCDNFKWDFAAGTEVCPGDAFNQQCILCVQNWKSTCCYKKVGTGLNAYTESGYC